MSRRRMQAQDGSEGLSIKVGIFSDTHRKAGRAKKIIDLLVSVGCEHIVHAGDIVEEAVLKELKKCGLPFTAVLGNNDKHLRDLKEEYSLVYEPSYFGIGGLKFKLMHIPIYLNPDADVVIFGHTHKKYINFTGKTLFLNPGEACARNKEISECMTLDASDEKFVVAYYYRKVKTDMWNKHETEFLR